MKSFTPFKVCWAEKSGSPAGYGTNSLLGGQNIYNSHGQLSGYTVNGLFGGKDGFINDNLFDASEDS